LIGQQTRGSPDLLLDVREGLRLLVGQGENHVQSAAGKLIEALGPSARQDDRSVEENLQYGRLAMECLVTFAVLFVSLYLRVRDSGTADSQKWASGEVGAAVGYWLKGTNNGHRQDGHRNRAHIGRT
jgi:hypothetical protein